MENGKNKNGKMTLDKIGAMVARGLDTMVTKDDFSSLKNEVASISSKLSRIEVKLDDHQELLDSHEKDILNLKHKVSVLGRKQA